MFLPGMLFDLFIRLLSDSFLFDIQQVTISATDGSVPRRVQ